MDFTSADITELASLLALPDLDNLTAVRMARNDVNAGHIETAILRLMTDADKIRSISRPLYNIITQRKP